MPMIDGEWVAGTLPIFHGLTVDERLKQFRWFDDDGMLHWLDFDTGLGRMLYNAYTGVDELDHTVLSCFKTVATGESAEAEAFEED